MTACRGSYPKRRAKDVTDPTQAVNAIKGAKLVNFELYNLRDDIGEQHNLAEIQVSRLAGMAGVLRGLFEQIQRECQAWPALKRQARQ